MFMDEEISEKAILRTAIEGKISSFVMGLESRKVRLFFFVEVGLKLVPFSSLGMLSDVDRLRGNIVTSFSFIDRDSS